MTEMHLTRCPMVWHVGELESNDDQNITCYGFWFGLKSYAK